MTIGKKRGPIVESGDNREVQFYLSFSRLCYILGKEEGWGGFETPPCCGLLSVPSFKWGDIGVEREIVIKNNFTFKECRSKKRR